MRKKKREVDFSVNPTAHLKGILWTSEGKNGTAGGKKSKAEHTDGVFKISASRPTRRRPVIIALIVALVFTSVYGIFGFAMPEKYDVTVKDGERAQFVTTTEKTVMGVLEELDVTLAAEDEVIPSRIASVNDGMTIEVVRAKEIYIHKGDQVIPIKKASGTVREALRDAGFAASSDDEISAELDTPITDGQHIYFTDVRVEEEEALETLPFETVKEEDFSLAEGTEKVAVAGQEGQRRTVTRIVYKNDAEVSREIVLDEVTQQPVNEVVKVGTFSADSVSALMLNKLDAAHDGISEALAATPTPTPKATPKKTQQPASTPKATPKPDNNETQVTPAPTPEPTPTPEDEPVSGGDSLPGGLTQDQVARVANMKATAYTHTGNQTATGTWPKVGTIAVDPRVIPLGTRVYVVGYGYAVAEDTGGAIKGNIIDLFMETENQCINWGRRNVTVYILK